MFSGDRAFVAGVAQVSVSRRLGRGALPAAAGRSCLFTGLAIALVAMVPGCAPLPAETGAAAPADAVFASPTDPLAAFAERTAPGREGVVQLANGRIVRARVARVYAAASGRECREVLSGIGAEERAQLFCRGPAADGGSWAEARPLLAGRRQP